MMYGTHFKILASKMSRFENEASAQSLTNAENMNRIKDSEYEALVNACQ